MLAFVVLLVLEGRPVQLLDDFASLPQFWFVRGVVPQEFFAHLHRSVAGVDQFVLGHHISVCTVLLLEHPVCVFLYLLALIDLLSCSVVIAALALLCKVVRPVDRALLRTKL